MVSNTKTQKIIDILQQILEVKEADALLQAKERRVVRTLAIKNKTEEIFDNFKIHSNDLRNGEILEGFKYNYERDMQSLARKLNKIFKDIDILVKKQNLLDNDMLICLFKNIHDYCQLEFIYFSEKYGEITEEKVKQFAKQALKIEDASGIKEYKDTDPNLIAKFVKKEFPNLWGFVWQYYTDNKEMPF
jgi:hypothetical protein